MLLEELLLAAPGLPLDAVEGQPLLALVLLLHLDRVRHVAAFFAPRLVVVDLAHLLLGLEAALQPGLARLVVHLLDGPVVQIGQVLEPGNHALIASPPLPTFL